jgi:hypothetical protein
MSAIKIPMFLTGVQKLSLCRVPAEMNTRHTGDGEITFRHQVRQSFQGLRDKATGEQTRGDTSRLFRCAPAIAGLVQRIQKKTLQGNITGFSAL